MLYCFSQSHYLADISATGRGPPQHTKECFVGALQPLINAECERWWGVCNCSHISACDRCSSILCVSNSFWTNCSFSVTRMWGKHWKTVTSSQTTTALWRWKALAQPPQVGHCPATFQILIWIFFTRWKFSYCLSAVAKTFGPIGNRWCIMTFALWFFSSAY